MKKYLIYVLLACFFLMSFSGCSGSKDGDEDSSQVTITRKPGTPADIAEEEEEVSEGSRFVVQSVNGEEEKIVLKSLTYNKRYVYKYSLTTKFLDKYGDTTSSANFTPGDVVVLGDQMSDGVLESIQKSKDVWEFDDVEVFDLNMYTQVLNINDTNYRLTDNTQVFSNEIEGGLGDIGADDVLKVIGLDKEILSISVTTGHGYLTLANTDKFEGSLIYVGSKIITTVTKDMTITVPEGSYDVTVANDGYGGTKTVDVVRNETTLLDLAELEGEGPKTCKLTVSSAVEGAQIYLDGSQIESGKEIEVSYGKHSLMISVEGYNTWNRTLYVNSPTAEITVDPTESDTSSDSSSSDSSSSSSTDSSSTSNSNSSNSSSNSSSSTGSTDSSSSSNSSSSSSSSDTSDSELDYLSTISSLINSLTSSSN